MASPPDCGGPSPRSLSGPLAPLGTTATPAPPTRFTTSDDVVPTVPAPRGGRPRNCLTLATAHCTIIGIDIEGFGQPHRSNTNRVRIRDGLYEAVQRAFHLAAIPWASCTHEDLGDGLLILAPADIPKPRFADDLPDRLAEEIRRHNATHPREEKMRLRLSLHAGEINYDEHGVTGASIIHAFRLLEAHAFKATLAANAALMAVISSAWFFEEVIRHSENSSAAAYRLTDVTHKETTTQAWIRLIRRSRRRSTIQPPEARRA